MSDRAKRIKKGLKLYEIECESGNRYIVRKPSLVEIAMLGEVPVPQDLPGVSQANPGSPHPR